MLFPFIWHGFCSYDQTIGAEGKPAIGAEGKPAAALLHR